jgi:hypothetical protein
MDRLDAWAARAVGGAAGDDEHRVWEAARRAALEARFGKMDDVVGHAPVPFQFGPEAGGAADVYFFRQVAPGVVAVTAELIGRDDQVPSSLGNYELAICHRQDETWGPNLVSRLAHHTLEARLEPGETMDIASIAPPGSAIAALLFQDFGRFEVRGRAAGVLLCIGITADELAACHEGRRAEVEQRLRATGIHPFTDLFRPSVVARRKLWGLF